VIDAARPRIAEDQREQKMRQKTTRQPAHALSLRPFQFGCLQVISESEQSILASRRVSPFGLCSFDIRMELAPAPSRYIDRQRETGFPPFPLQSSRFSPNGRCYPERFHSSLCIFLLNRESCERSCWQTRLRLSLSLPLFLPWRFILSLAVAATCA